MDTEPERREQVRKHLKERRDFYNHLITYVVVNTAIIVVWALTGGGYFWPAWVLLGWGVGIVMHGLAVLGPLREVTEEDVDRELKRMDHR